jgi:MFS family permease
MLISNETMSNRNTYYLSASNLTLRVVAQGLLPLYPVLLIDQSISRLWIGYFMAGLYVAIFLGNWFSGKLLNRGFSLKKIVVLTYIPIVIGLLGMGFQNNYLHLFYYTAFMSFFNGINLNINTVILGGYSNGKDIMKNFAWIGLSSILATLFGGILIGPALHYFGNLTAFIGFAAFIGFSCIFSLLLQDVSLRQKEKTVQKFRYDSQFIVLLASLFLLAMLIHFFKIGLSLKMKELGYNISQISIFSTLGTMLVVPMPFILSYLNHKISSIMLLLSTHLTTLISFVLVYFFTKDVYFVFAISGVNYMAYCTRIPLMKILHTMFDDLDFARAQTIYGSMVWLAAIVGYLSAGYILEKSGFNTAFFIGGSLAILSGLLFRFGIKMSK